MNELQHISSAEQLGRCVDEWDSLAREVPFRRPAWLLTWWNHFYGGNDTSIDPGRAELCTLAVRNEHRDLIGLAPWYIERSVAHGSTIRFLGSNQVCSDYLSILCTREDEVDVANQLADWLLGDGRRCWDSIELKGVDAEDVMVRRLIDALESRGCLVRRRPGPNCWRLPFPASWDDYLATLSKSHRKQVRRLQRRMLDEQQAVLRAASNEEELQQGLEILFDFQHRRRRLRGEATSFNDPTYREFLTAAARQFLRLGLLRLHWLEIDGQPAAVDYLLAGDGVLYAYQGGIDPDRLEAEPGTLAFIATAELAIAEGVMAYDFLRGDEPYKQHWRAVPRPSLEIRVVSPSVKAQVRHRVRQAGESVKQLIKTGLRRTAT